MRPMGERIHPTPDQPPYYGPDWHRVTCSNEDCSCFMKAFPDVEPAADDWNTRANLAYVIKPLEWYSDFDGLSSDVYGIKRAFHIAGQPGDWTLRYLGDNRHEYARGIETQVYAKRLATKLHFDRVAPMLEQGGA